MLKMAKLKHALHQPGQSQPQEEQRESEESDGVASTLRWLSICERVSTRRSIPRETAQVAGFIGRMFSKLDKADEAEPSKSTLHRDASSTFSRCTSAWAASSAG